jgi:hypothetical protein
MGNSFYTLGVDEWEEAGVRYVRSFRDQITFMDIDKRLVEDPTDHRYDHHYVNARGELVAAYPNGEARYREGDRLSNNTASFYYRVYERIDYPPPGWPPKPPSSGHDPGYDDFGNYID